MKIGKFPVRAVIFQKRGKGLSAFYDTARYNHKEQCYELRKYDAKFKPTSFDDFVIMNNGKPLVLLYEFQRNNLVPISTADIDILYEIDSSGKTVYEKTHYKCNNEHYIEKPLIRIEGKIKKKQVEYCPICGSDVIIKLNEPQFKPKIKKMINLHALPEDMQFWGQMRRWKAEERHKNESWLLRNKELIIFAMVFVFFIILSYIFMSSISDNTKSLISALEGLKTNPAEMLVNKPPG